MDLPSSLKAIGEGAFESCQLLEKIEIPAFVNRIKKNTFKDCSSMASH